MSVQVVNILQPDDNDDDEKREENTKNGKYDVCYFSMWEFFFLLDERRNSSWEVREQEKNKMQINLTMFDCEMLLPCAGCWFDADKLC